MGHRKKILAIPGSIRTNSSNESILKFIAQKYYQLLDVEIYYGLDKLPHFNPDMDFDIEHGEVKELRSKIEKADGVLICSPEYVFSIPGALKNAIEWTVSTTVFSHKPVAIIVASGLGEKAYESLILIMTTLYAKLEADSNLLIAGARAKLKNNEITDTVTLEQIDKMVSSLINSINANIPNS